MKFIITICIVCPAGGFWSAAVAPNINTKYQTTTTNKGKINHTHTHNSTYTNIVIGMYEMNTHHRA